MTKSVAEGHPYAGLAYVSDGMVSAVSQEQMAKWTEAVFVSEDVSKVKADTFGPPSCREGQ